VDLHDSQGYELRKGFAANPNVASESDELNLTLLNTLSPNRK